LGGISRFEDAPLGRHVAGSLTIGAALASGAGASGRYCGDQQLWVTQRGDDVWLQRRHSGALRRGRRQANDFALQLLIDLLRRGAGPRWRPTELHLEGPPPGHAEELAALAVRSTHFGAVADGLVFPRSVLARPLPPARRPVGPAAPPLPDLDFVDSVRRTIRFLLEVGELGLPNVAETAGTSARSLQRRLAAAGLGFTRLVDEARFQAASRLLRDPAIRIIDVSVALGYTDGANFTRAFRRWAGVAPLAFRLAESQNDASAA
jgi:AraC-like DNA-binding protein